MISQEQARAFAHEWIAAWNSHDLERILAHYAEDFEMTSPVICQVVNEPSGTLKGKAKVGAYWQKALEKMPDLHFELLTVLVSIDSIALYYKGAAGKLAAEVLFFGADGKIIKGIAHYAV